MEKLYMGKIDRDDPVFKIQPDDVEAHTFITGQSGSGKSSIVSRFIEELIMREVGSVFLLDYNFEFSKFDQVDDESFLKDWNQNNCDEDSKGDFRAKWDSYSANFKIISANKLNIYYSDIFSSLKAFLYGIDQEVDAGAFWLIQLIDQEPHDKLKIRNKGALREFISNITRWYERRMISDDYEIEEIIYQIRQFVNILDLTKFINGANSLIKQPYINFGRRMPSRTTLNNDFFNELYGHTKFCSIDLLSFKYEDYMLRDFIALYALLSIWRIAEERYRLSKENGSSDDKFIFIVIDEAHNIIPDDSEADTGVKKEIVKFLKTVAAEGRKFGLFLILISQRPDKINSNVISECDNFIVMKSAPPTIEKLDKIIPIEKNKNAQLKDSFKFKKGEALYYGKFTNYRPDKVAGDIKRTM